LLLSVLAACSSPETSREVDSVADTQGLTTIPAETATTTPAETATTTPAEDTATDPGPDLEDEEPTLLSAFYGLDDALPPISAALCDGAPGMDGLVVVVNDRLTTVTGDQFEVVTRSGARLTPMCATLAPADEPEERRTVLLIGDLGNAATDPPVEVITPRSLDTDIAVDGARYAGRSIAVTPLGDGPTLVATEWAEPTADCPAGTIATLRVAWAGGIVLTDGTEIAPDDTALYNLTIDDPSQSPVELTGLGDLGDNDNYHELCTTSTPRPVVITVAAGTFQDPNGDANPAVKLANG
jgi:hypothetical protein